jgi:FMN phosphatase YigB (HAD superfamily)
MARPSVADSGDKIDSSDLPESLIAQAAALRASGFFDEAYYRAQRPNLASEADAAVDYLLHGTTLAPGPLFDSATYLDKYPDVAAANSNPLLHYLNHGRAEGRGNVFAPTHSPQQKLLLTVSLPPARRDIMGLAVVVYAAYPEALTEICKSLCAVPGRFTLLIAVATEAAKTIAEDAVAQSGLNVCLECRTARDTRRRLAALFSEFAQDVLRHEYILHLHTRKPRSSRPGTYGAAGSLIASGPLVDTFIQTFETHANVGLIYSAAQRPKPHWAQRWFSKEDIARKFLNKIGITPEADDENTHYPVEGEFWARVDALRPIFEAGLSCDDFPNERGLTDGAHTFMRAMAAVARARHYSFVEYDATTGELRLDRGDGNPGPYLAGNVDRFSRMAFDADLISFDVFDTLLLRDSVTPDSVQRYAGQLLNELHPATASEFFQRRKRAEHAARAERAFQGDVGLSEIYSKFERTAVWTEEVIALARRLEEETDARSLRKRPEIEDMLRFAKSEGKRIIALSDTYYSTDQVRDLLRREELADFFDAFYVSSDQNARKDRGDLWDKVLAREKIAPNRWLHVGDNEHSDLQAAAKRKVKCLHLMRPATLVEIAGLNLTPPETLWATDLFMGPAANRLATNATVAGVSLPRLVLRDAEEIGFCVLGPIVFAFLCWLVGHPALKSVSSLHFLSREGFLLHRIYQLLCDQYPALALPPGSYLYASRRAALSASQALEFAPRRLLPEVRFEGSMADLLSQRIGLELTQETDLANWSLKLPEDEDKVLSALQLLEDRIVAHASDELAAYRTYLEQTGLTNSLAPAVVDIGYSATIQAGLQIIAERPMTGFYLGTTPKARQVEERAGRAFGYLTENMGSESSVEPVMVYSLLMEAFLIAPHGQLTAFRSIDDKVVPVFRRPSHDKRSAAVLAALHDGAARYCSRLMTVYGESIWRTAIDKRALQEPFKALVEGILDIPEELRSIIHVEDDFCDAGIWNPLKMPTAPWRR